MAKDNKGKVALTALLDMAAITWVFRSSYDNSIKYRPDIPSRIATLLRHGSSPDLQGSSYFHQLGRTKGVIVEVYEVISNCFCVLIKGGADIHAVDVGMSVTEFLHFCRRGHLWEHALELCGLNVDEVYAIDHYGGSDKSDDLYAPTDQRPRVRGPMDIRAYDDVWWKGSQRCATIHRTHRSHETESDAVREKWIGKRRWPNGMVHEGHDPDDEASGDSSSEQEKDNRARASSDSSEHNSDTEDGSDEEMGGVPI